MVGIENLQFKRKILVMSCYPPPNDARFVTHFINALNLVDFNNLRSKYKRSLVKSFKKDYELSTD